MKKVAAILIVATIILASLTVVLYAGLGSARGFSKTDLVTPSIDYLQWSSGAPPNPATSVRQWTDWYIVGRTSEGGIYSEFGGVVWLSVTNSGPRDMYVYGAGLSWVGTSVTYHKDADVLIESGETREIGLLSFGAPVEPGERAYEMSLEYAVKETSGSAWYDYGAARTTADVLDVQRPVAARSWDTERNPANYFDEVNSRIDTEAVSSVVSGIRSNLSGGYNILQACAAYEWARRNIEYKLDDGDYWQSADESMSLRSGDCEDGAILLCSILTGLGGCARVNIIEKHAFASLYVGDGGSDLTVMEDAIASYYRLSPGASKVNYLIDDTGYWMLMDTYGVPHVGGLPAECSYAFSGEGEGTWTFTGSDFLITIDATGQSSKLLGLF
jgi:hypothetical protein